MSDYIISCCSTADLTEEHFKNRNISYICFHYSLDGVSYPDDLGKTMPFDKFYQAMTDGAETKTWQINPEEYVQYFEPMLAAGKDVIHLCLSSGISGVLNSAQLAQEELSEKYPERKIYVLDSLAASSGFGLIMDKLADLRDEGKSIDELKEFVEVNRRKLNHWFFSSDLTFFIKGGRVSKTAGFFGGMLNICPLLNVDVDGRLIPRKNIRTKKKAILALVDRMEENADDGLDYSGKCYICNSACEADAQAVADLVEQRFPKLDGKPEIYSIGTTIGAHTGPGTVAVFFWGKERVD